MNALSVDLEDYFQVSNFEHVIDRDSWPALPSRVAANTHRLLETFDETWAGKYPMIGESWKARWELFTPFLAFPEPIEPIDGVPDETEVSLACDGVSCDHLDGVWIVDNEMTVVMHDVPDATCLAIMVDGIVYRIACPWRICH